ncbi:TRAP transporter large permease subunit [Ponticoccus sp. SC2-23]|uniref:TRAP transporter large permease n=1 Tax=Alexandriicola marinus TaxID=2081710 RepID=UPI000FD7BD0D|nr:TRAP transporter large permease subunit [Alexandriicola marinus]MBM1219179.1 TRAP transporter large permease subunit [Ponticoccus sp. SC6-9]MBM1223749.1 TRAP transporter large permease subunit [Ponticoccus sp. SC6-15]MBM1228993.1 TRAP transporter large permease subunit [Ponticoccus sp. SC6-38]MBM1232715.1 TRAP transporter large permease subunit [Ponticoccus sp. SC6-45]MBM1237335.1 TRAP transporter large permease subunit [Ponticoccus sp. SC6-49]MBM1241726.1 TRAP transporter large permease s
MGGDIVLWMLGLLVLLILLGTHIGVALAICSGIGVWLMLGALEPAISILGNTAYEAVRKDVFAVIPLFVLMGEFISKSGAAGDLYRVCDRTMKRLPGRLAIATITGNTIFAAVTGVSIASAAAFSRIAYPEMMKVGYKQTFALGAVAGSACLGMLIPPSVLLIVWAILTEQSVGALFIAGIIPGIVLALLFIAYVIIAAVRSPDVAPPFDGDLVKLTPEEVRSEVIGSFGIIFLIFLVIGGIWTGWFNPTQAAGFGALGALLIAVIKGLGWRELYQAVLQAGRTTAPIMFLLITASMYSRLLGIGGAVNFIQGLFAQAGLDPWQVIALMVVIWLIMGMLIDSVSIILLTVPIFSPIAASIGIDPIAFAIFGILVIEAGLLTPPFGLLVYTVRGAVPDKTATLGKIFIGSTPYFVLILVAAFIVLFMPWLATALPAALL